MPWFKPLIFTLVALIISAGFSQTSYAASDRSPSSRPPVVGVSAKQFISLLNTTDITEVISIIKLIESDWHEAYLPIMIESLTHASSNATALALVQSLSKMTGQSFGFSVSDWYQWLWNRPEAITANYAEFKAELYRHIDPRFDGYFRGRQALARIRLDEIQWGGVVQDGIPPLRNPRMIPASKAHYLAGDNVVFGVEINGDARAYPKRILAWHEMFTDTVGGVDIAGVYCTLCGTVIPYKTRYKDTNYALGTSGFLYRSNKLMYDAKTQSLWNTLRGEPVLGPLVGRGIKLEFLSIVTTTWEEWKRRHPQTTVLSLDTGYRRDYGEGVAYKSYFATDDLMFNTPFNDTRLKNKQEVLALRFVASPKEQLAIDTDFLNRNPLYLDRVGRQKLLVLTDKSGANRVYDPKHIVFTRYDRDRTITDSEGEKWLISEEYLTAADGRKLPRLPYHRAFWFGWHATFPDTKLVK